jgi:DNA-3-methyladenine glycosylase
MLTQDFFSQDSHKVATQLLGKVLCRKTDDSIIRLSISEVEVYDGARDKASHASKKNAQHGRASLMFGPPGYWYVYLCYGMHWMLNVVTREEGYPAAILIRGTSELSGPGRLTRHLKIDRSLNGTLASKRSGLWIESPPSASEMRIQRTPRIGIDYAGNYWTKRLLRYTGA